MPITLTDDPTSFPAVTTPAGTDVPNAASLQTTAQQLANRTAFLRSHDTFAQLQAMLASTWFNRSSGVTVTLRAIAGLGAPYGTGPIPPNSASGGAVSKNIAVGDSAAAPCTILTSGDGVAWEVQTGVGTSTSAFGVVNGLTVAAVIMNGASGQNIQTSPDGIVWTLRASGITLASHVGGIAYGITKAGTVVGFVVVGGVGGAAAVSSSPDGITWTARTLGTAVDQMTTVCWSPQLELFIAAGFNTGTNLPEIFTSPDMINWTQRAVPGGTANHAAVVGAQPNSINGVTQVLMVSAIGELWTSADALTWVAMSNIGANAPTALLHTGNQWLMFFAVTFAVLQSINAGVTWNARRLLGVAGVLNPRFFVNGAAFNYLGLPMTAGNNGNIYVGLEAPFW